MNDADQLKGALRLLWNACPSEVQQLILAEARTRMMGVHEFLQRHKVTPIRKPDGAWVFEIKLREGKKPT